MVSGSSGGRTRLPASAEATVFKSTAQHLRQRATEKYRWLREVSRFVCICATLGADVTFDLGMGICSCSAPLTVIAEAANEPVLL